MYINSCKKQRRRIPKYDKSQEYVANGLIPVSISLLTPDWWNGPVYKKLAPTERVLGHYRFGNKNRTEDQKIRDYLEDYRRDVLDSLDPREGLEDLSKFGDLDKIVLCCYERPSEFCHRHIVASWLRVKCGVECREFSLYKNITMNPRSTDNAKKDERMKLMPLDIVQVRPIPGPLQLALHLKRLYTDDAVPEMPKEIDKNAEETA